MRILLTNDDGVRASGLKVLEAIARTLSDDITIVAPAEEASGAGHSLTLTRPVRLRRLDERRYAVTGTPISVYADANSAPVTPEPTTIRCSGSSVSA